MLSIQETIIQERDTGVSRPVPDKSSIPESTLEQGDLVRRKDHCIGLTSNKNYPHLKNSYFTSRKSKYILVYFGQKRPLVHFQFCIESEF